MPSTFRASTFNVENLFGRAKILNFEDNGESEGFLNKVEELKRELRKTTYDPATKASIKSLAAALKGYATVEEVRGKLFDRKGDVVAGGSSDWGGFIAFPRAKFSGPARQNTARVIREMRPDVCCLVEVESRPVLKTFASELLGKAQGYSPYDHHMLIDGNDTRGIDVALATRYPIRRICSHVDDKDAAGNEIFSRDCLEVEMEIPGGRRLTALVNHFKSKGYGDKKTADQRRRTQAEAVTKILGSYDLTKDLVIVAGDFNDTPTSTPLSPLLQTKDLHDVLGTLPPAERWTYYYKTAQQIDFLLVSTPLKAALQDVGVERRGMSDIAKISKGAVQPFSTVKQYKDSASDHAGIWAEFRI